jgi:hypothetical protein
MKGSSRGLGGALPSSISGGAGARVGITDRIGVVLDGRVHGIGTDFSTRTGEVILGLRLKLGR